MMFGHSGVIILLAWMFGAWFGCWGWPGTLFEWGWTLAV